MSVEALTVIRDLQTALRETPPRGIIGRAVIAPYIGSYGEQLDALEPFRAVAQGWILRPLGGCKGTHTSVHWVAERLLAGEDPEVILASARRVIEANEYEGLEIRPVRGISVTQRYQLTDTAYLCPNAELPSGCRREEAFRHPHLGPGYDNDTAALVQIVMVKPAIVASSEVPLPKASADARAERAAFADRLRLALGLVSGKAVEMPALYDAVDAQCVLTAAGRGMIGSGQCMPSILENVPANIENASALIPKFTAMHDSQALKLSIDRLLSSRRGRSIEDQMIDLGMAAEIALMHTKDNPGNGKAEITNKLGARGAWLLGTNAEDRLKVQALVADLYSARSEVVHTGIASPKYHSRMPEFDKLASDIALALLNKGGFPDWKSLVLGGPG
jgi:Apea-like HEPN